MGLPRSSLVKKQQRPSPEPEIVTNESLLKPTPQEISKDDLLERAAALGPIRTSWETYSSEDPILSEKMKEHVALRRARFQKIVKGTLGACVGICAIALVVTLVSGGEGSANAATASGARTAQTVVEPSIEKLEIVKRGRARKAPPPSFATWSWRGKRR